MAIKTKVYNSNAEAVGEMDLAKKVFGLAVNAPLIHQALVAQQANSRQVLAHTKGRSEVRGGGKKPWRQKGTGRARAGSSRSPIWIGGGVTFGPTKDRNFTKKINKKMRQAALFMVLSDRLQNGDLVIIDKLETEEYKTKIINNLLNNLSSKILIKKTSVDEVKVKEEKKTKAVKATKKEGASRSGKKQRSILIINSQTDEKAKYSSRNLAGVKLLCVDNINLIDLLKYKHLVMTKDTAAKLAERYNKA